MFFLKTFSFVYHVEPVHQYIYYVILMKDFSKNLYSFQKNELEVVIIGVFKDFAKPHRCFHLFILIRTLLRMMLVGVMLGITFTRSPNSRMMEV